MIQISVNSQIFIITSNDTVTLTKDKNDILCCVSSKDTAVVEIWETSTNESNKKLIFASSYLNFSSPTGSTASVVCASINQLLKSGSPLNQDTPFCYLSSSSTQTLADPTLGQVIVFDTNEIVNNITHSTSINTGRVTIQYAGTYTIHLEAIATSSSASKEAYFWLRVNGNDVPRSANQVGIVNSNDTKAVTLTWDYNFQVGDYLECIFGGNSTAISLPYYSTITSPTRPTTPSVNLSVELI